MWGSIAQAAKDHLQRSDTLLDRVGQDIVIHTRSAIDRAHERLAARIDRLTRRIPQLLADREREVDEVATRVRLLDPMNVLARGWSITRTASGRVVRSIDDVSIGESIVTLVSNGSLVSTIDDIVADSTTRDKEP